MVFYERQSNHCGHYTNHVIMVCIMKSRLDDRKKAIELRKNGLSYKEIQEIISVSKGVLSGWFKDLDFSDDEITLLAKNKQVKQHKGRLKASVTNKQKRVVRENAVFTKAEKEFIKLKDDSMFLIGVSLYWAEGSKRTGEFQFINSDPNMITFMYLWIQRYLSTDKKLIKARLFTHKIEDYEEHLPFWSRILDREPSSFDKTIFKPTIHTVKKNPNYKGCLRLTVASIDTLRMMGAWQNLLIAYYKDLMHP